MERLGEYILSYKVPLNSIADKMAKKAERLKKKSGPLFPGFSILIQQIKSGKIASTAPENIKLLAFALSRENGKTQKEILDDIYEILRYAKDATGEYGRHGYLWHNILHRMKLTGPPDIAIDLAEAHNVVPSKEFIDSTGKALDKLIKSDIIRKLPYSKLIDTINMTFSDVKGIGNQVLHGHDKRVPHTNVDVMSAAIVTAYLNYMGKAEK
jgi:hypothetical protein